MQQIIIITISVLVIISMAAGFLFSGASRRVPTPTREQILFETPASDGQAGESAPEVTVEPTAE